jgi:hypothetical protein
VTIVPLSIHSEVHQEGEVDPQMATKVHVLQESERVLQAATLLAAILQEEAPSEAVPQEEVQQEATIEVAAYPLIVQVPLRFHPSTLHQRQYR